MQVFELAAPGQIDPGGHFDGSDSRLGLVDEATQIAAAYVGLDHNATAPIVAADLVRTLGDFDSRHRRQWDHRAIRRCDR